MKNTFEVRFLQYAEGQKERDRAVDRGIKMYARQSNRNRSRQFTTVRVSNGVIRRRLIVTEGGEV